MEGDIEKKIITVISAQSVYSIKSVQIIHVYCKDFCGYSQ